MAKAGNHNRRQAITAEIAHIDSALPGSVVVRHRSCGKPTCRCQADPPELHGPYIQWTRKVDGKTTTRVLTAEQYQRYWPWFDNARRLRELTRELEALSVDAFEHTENRPPRRN